MIIEDVMKAIRVALLLIAGGGMLGACGASVTTSGSFTDHGFLNARYPYAIKAQDGHLLPVGDDWRLTNFQFAPDGRPSQLKKGKTWRSTWKFDTNGDGKDDAEVTGPRYDLLLEHRKHGGELWVSTIPVDESLEDKEPQALARRWVEGARSSGRTTVVVVDDKRNVGVAVTEQKEYATRLLSIQPARFADRQGAIVTFDVAEVTQQQVTPDTSWHRARVAILKTPFHARAGKSQQPVFIIVGYSNRLTDFERSLDDHTLLLANLATFDPGATLAAQKSDEVLRCVDGQEATIRVDVNGAGVVYTAGSDQPIKTRSCIRKALKGYPVAGAAGLEMQVRFAKDVPGLGELLKPAVVVEPMPATDQPAMPAPPAPPAPPEQPGEAPEAPSTPPPPATAPR